eukprot:364721-Chlamydomonas_euryale.AAC.5
MRRRVKAKAQVWKLAAHQLTCQCRYSTATDPVFHCPSSCTASLSQGCSLSSPSRPATTAGQSCITQSATHASHWPQTSISPQPATSTTTAINTSFFGVLITINLLEHAKCPLLLHNVLLCPTLQLNAVYLDSRESTSNEAGSQDSTCKRPPE